MMQTTEHWLGEDRPKRFHRPSAYAGHVFDGTLAHILPHLKTEIVKRSDRARVQVASA